jgi:sugar (pentulose or hexulose) kinase
MSADAMRKQLDAADDLIVGVSNQPGAYYAENSTRYFGKLLEAVARLLGADDPAQFYQQANARLEAAGGDASASGAAEGGSAAPGGHSAAPGDYGSLAPGLPLFFVEGDRVVRQSMTGFDVARLDISADRDRVVQGLYLYLATMTKMVAEELGAMFTEPQFIAGGGASRNIALMQLTADVLGRPVSLLEQSELSALGAAVTAAESAGDRETIEHTRAGLELSTLEPSSRQREAAQRAEEMRDELVKRFEHTRTALKETQR